MNTNQWNVILHLSGFAAFVFPAIGNWAAPLIIWLLKKQDSPEIDRTGKEVLNFQFSYTLYCVVAAVLMAVLVGFILLPILGLMWIIFMILGAMKASNGEFYSYPLTIRFLQ